MFIFKQGQRVYLPAWELNTCRMLGKLADMVESHGGKVHRPITVMATYQSKPDMEPVEIWGTGYIGFVLNGVLYKFNVDDNFLFDHLYCKTPMVGNKYSQNVYFADLGGGWEIRGLLSSDCDDETVAYATEKLYEALMKAPMSERYNDPRRKEYVEWE